MSSKPLSGQTAFVSGSTAGIGMAIVQALLADGAHVILNGRHPQTVEGAVSRLREQHPQADVTGIAADLGTAAGCDAVAASLAGVDILVNNLGIFEPKPFEQIADTDWQRLFEVNVMSGVRLARAALSGMLARNRGNRYPRRQGVLNNPLTFFQAPRSTRYAILRRRHLVSTSSMVDT